MLPPFSGAATSQSTISHVQIDSGDVFATQTLNVDDTAGPTSAVGTATGNGVTAAVVTGSLNVQLGQTMSGATRAQTTLNVGTYAGGLTTMVTAATANTAEVDSLGGGGLTGAVTQVANGASVSAENDFTASAALPTDPTVGVANVTASAQAIANSVSIGVIGGSTNMSVSQSSTTSVDGESGSAPPVGGATVQHTSGTASFSSIAVNNNVTATGTSGANQTLNVTQTATGDHTIAGQFLNVGSGQTVQGEAAASANNISASNESGDLNVTSNQSNATYTQADSVVTAYEFGSAQSTASGVGNSLMAANYGPSTELSSNQSNNAEVDSSASFTGGNTNGGSYDAATSATAVGNAVTAFSCSDCGGVINVGSTQTNTNTISATATTELTGSTRSISSTATAVGNNATFYVSQPTR